MGDVVEFEYSGRTLKAIVFLHNGELDFASTNNALLFEAKNIRKIGQTNILPDKDMSFDEADPIAKAYFSKPATPEFKVGDKVKVARAKGGTISWLSSMNSFLGEVCTVAYASTNSVSVHENSWSWPIESLDPA